MSGAPFKHISKPKTFVLSNVRIIKTVRAKNKKPNIAIKKVTYRE